MVSTVRNFILLSHRAATQRQSNAVAFRVPATRFSQGPLPGPSALSRTYMLTTSVGSLAQPFLLVRRYIDLATRIAALNATSNRALASGAQHAATSQTGAAARASNAKAQAIPTKIAVERSANTKRDMDSSRKI